MANDFMTQFNTQDLQLRRPQAVDLSQLSQRYGREFGQLEQAEALQRQADVEQARMDVAGQREQLLAEQSARGLGAGVYGEYERAPVEAQAAQYLTDKEMKKLYEGEMKRNIRVQNLRERLASRQMDSIQRNYNVQMANWRQRFEQLRQDVAYKMADEEREAKYRLQQDYNRSVDELNKSLLGRQKRQAIAGGIGQLLGGAAGFLLSGFNPLGAVAGSKIGGSAAGAFGNIGQNRYYKQLQQSIYV